MRLCKFGPAKEQSGVVIHAVADQSEPTTNETV